MKYKNINTGEIIRQVGTDDTALVEEERAARDARETKKRKVIEVLATNVDETETALGKKVLDYSAEELAERAKGGMARFDFQKYLREYRLEEQEDGSSHLVRISNHAVCNKLTREETLVYRQNPHIQQVGNKQCTPVHQHACACDHQPALRMRSSTCVCMQPSTCFVHATINLLCACDHQPACACERIPRCWEGNERDGSNSLNARLRCATFRSSHLLIGLLTQPLGYLPTVSGPSLWCNMRALVSAQTHFLP